MYALNTSKLFYGALIFLMAISGCGLNGLELASKENPPIPDVTEPFPVPLPPPPQPPEPPRRIEFKISFHKVDGTPFSIFSHFTTNGSSCSTPQSAQSIVDSPGALLLFCNYPIDTSTVRWEMRLTEMQTCSIGLEFGVNNLGPDDQASTWQYVQGYSATKGYFFTYFVYSENPATIEICGQDLLPKIEARWSYLP